MKKKVLLLLAAVLSLAAQAQRFEEVQKSSGEYVVPIPGIFTCDGKARAAVGVRDTYYDTKLYDSFRIIDENLKEEATVKVENNVKPYTLVKARACDFKGEFREDVSRYYEGSKYDIGIENLDARAFTSCVYEGEVSSFAIVKETARTSTSVTFETDFDESAAKKYMADNNKEKIGYFKGTFVISAYKSISKISSCKVSSYTYKRVYNGDWKETKDFEGNRESLIALSYIDMNAAYDTDCLYVTQSLFNSDKAYEYIQPIYELYKGYSDDYDRDNDGEVDSMRVKYSLSAVGFSIVQEDGNILSSVKFGDGWSGGTFYDGFGLLNYLRFDNKNYIVANVYRIDDDGYRETASIFYAFTPGNPSSIKAVRTENHGIKATPAIARQSEVVNIDVSSFSNPRQIMVVNSNGQTMMQQAVAEGANSVKVKTAGLPAGLYVVKVSDGKSASDNCKIIIR